MFALLPYICDTDVLNDRNIHVFCCVQSLEEFVEIMANLNLPYPKKIGDFTSGISAFHLSFLNIENRLRWASVLSSFLKF
jgi:hypothetical protein